MSITTEITSLAEIRERKAEVRRELDRSKKEAASQLAATAGDAKTFVLQDVILPAAGVALGAYILIRVVKAVVRSGPEENQQEYLMAEYLEENTAGSAVTAQQKHSTASPVRTTSQAPRVKPAAGKPSSFQLASLMSLGQLLVPAGKEILNIIKENSQVGR